MDLLDESLYYGLGLAFWAWAHFLPFRSVPDRPAYRWDLISALAAAVFAAAAGFALAWARESAEATVWVQAWIEAVESLPWWGLVAAYVVIADFGAYWAHRLLHTRLLWSSHAWHHSPTVLYWLSGLRSSPVHVLVLFAPYVVAAMMLPVPEIAAVALAIAVLEIGNQHLIHSNIRLPWPARWERLLVTPRFHFVHHSATAERSNSNYGFIFSIWDRLFGTYTDPATVPADDPLGLDYQASPWRLLLGLPAQGNRIALPGSNPLK
jgi:sterol desaturase/sphingolipid hydroxylase (fatty acid hydroxylase superfamily)